MQAAVGVALGPVDAHHVGAPVGEQRAGHRARTPTGPARTTLMPNGLPPTAPPPRGRVTACQTNAPPMTPAAASPGQAGKGRRGGWRSGERRFSRDTETPYRDLHDRGSGALLAAVPHRRRSSSWPTGARLRWVGWLGRTPWAAAAAASNGVVDLTLVADAFGRHTAPGPVAAEQCRGGGAGAERLDEQRSETLRR